MGEANRRGNKEQRIQEAVARAKEKSVALTERRLMINSGGVSISDQFQRETVQRPTPVRNKFPSFSVAAALGAALASVTNLKGDGADDKA